MLMPLNAILNHYYLLELVLDLFDLAYLGFPEGVSPYPSIFLSVDEFLHLFLIAKIMQPDDINPMLCTQTCDFLGTINV